MSRLLLPLVLAGASLAWGMPSHAGQPVSAPTAELVRQVEIPFETFTLDNGLRVVVHEDRKAPVVAVAAWYNVGSKDEPEGKTGFAHLFEHIGLFNGTENFPEGLMEPLRAMGATDWNGTTWFDRTNYFQTVPTAALEQALYMESDRMGHLLGALTQERLDNQRGVVQNEKRQSDNAPFGLVLYRLLETLFPPGHPYRHSTIGSMADLDAASLDDVRRWFREKYGPNNAVLVLAGDIDTATARTLVQRYFGHIPRGPDNIPAAAELPTLPAPVVDRMTDRVANSRLYRSWAVPGLLHEDMAALAVAADVLGGLASSRLDNALVRGDRTAVGVTASMLPFQRVGMFILTVDVKPGEDVDSVSRRLDELIAELIADGPTEDEVRRVVTRRLSERIRGLEQVGGFTGKSVALAEGMLYAGDPGLYRRQLGALAAMEPGTVRQAAQRWLSRPVYALRVDPGEREPYVEAGRAGAAEASAPEDLRIIPRGPMPPVGEVGEINFPEIRRASLSNGIEVTYAQRATVPATWAAVDFNAGTAADSPDRVGAVGLMVNLLREGTSTRSPVAIAEEQERLGATIQVNQAMDRSTLTVSTLSANLGPSLALAADMVRNPAFAPDEVERVRGVMLARIAAERTNPSGIAARALPALLYGPDHPYGRPFTGTGDPEAVGAVGRDELAALHARWIRPDNAQIFVISDLPLERVLPLLEASFGGWAAPAAPRGAKAVTMVAPPARSRIVLIDRPQSPQSVILAGTLLPIVGTQDRLLITAANEVLAGDFLSRLNQDLRETRGWSYGVGGGVQSLEHQMPYFIQAPVQADQTGPSVAAILEHVRAFTSDRGVTPHELRRVVTGNVRQLGGGFETGTQLLSVLRGNALFRRPDDYWPSLAGRYRALTAADLDRAAQEALGPAALLFLVVGDAAAVRPQLEATGLPVEVIAPR